MQSYYNKATKSAIDIIINPGAQLSIMSAASLGKSFIGGAGPIGVGLATLKASRAGKGGFAPALLGSALTTLPSILLETAVFGAVSLIPGIGPILAPWAAGFAATGLWIGLGPPISRRIRLFTDLNKNIRHLEMGGSYQDSQLAQRQRMIAIQDMSSSMIPARRYLGQEARLMHR